MAPFVEVFSCTGTVRDASDEVHDLTKLLRGDRFEYVAS